MLEKNKPVRYRLPHAPQESNLICDTNSSHGPPVRCALAQSESTDTCSTLAELACMPESESILHQCVVKPKGDTHNNGRPPFNFHKTSKLTQHRPTLAWFPAPHLETPRDLYLGLPRNQTLGLPPRWRMGTSAGIPGISRQVHSACFWEQEDRVSASISAFRH